MFCQCFILHVTTVLSSKFPENGASARAREASQDEWKREVIQSGVPLESCIFYVYTHCNFALTLQHVRDSC